MEAIKLKGHPLTEEQLKAVKGGYVFIGFKNEPEPNVCPLCGDPLDSSEKKDDVYDENGNVVGHFYQCGNCGGMINPNEK